LVNEYTKPISEHFLVSNDTLVIWNHLDLLIDNQMNIGSVNEGAFVQVGANYVVFSDQAGRNFEGLAAFYKFGADCRSEELEQVNCLEGAEVHKHSIGCLLV
jgi:hypothetical protein